MNYISSIKLNNMIIHDGPQIKVNGQRKYRMDVSEYKSYCINHTVRMKQRKAKE